MSDCHFIFGGVGDQKMAAAMAAIADLPSVVRDSSLCLREKGR